jgi:hypothetical protein
VFDRIHEGATAFAQGLLEKVLLQQSAKGFVEGLFSAFGKVLLQDSTTLKLPPSYKTVCCCSYPEYHRCKSHEIHKFCVRKFHAK